MNEVLRQENKYLLTRLDFFQLCGVLREVMHEDAHNGPCGYNIRSLYFDTPYDDDFNDKIDGLELRRKIRLRIYSADDDFAMLEMKQKQGALQKKRSLRVSREDAIELTKCNYLPLQNYKDSFAAEIYGLMTRQAYRPKTVVEYNRYAFTANENNIRITFDGNIRASETNLELYAKNPGLSSVLDDFNLVLEVKFNGFLLSYIKDILRLADRSTLSVSKYCLARTDTLKFAL